MRLLLIALTPIILLAQDTTIQDKVLVTAGAPAKGYFLIGPTVPFTSSDGRYISTPPTKITLASDGSFSVILVPTTTATPSGATYTAEYHITNAGATSAQYTESWNVPPSTTPLRIKDVLVPATTTPPPSGGGGGTAQPPAGQLPDSSYSDIGQACTAAAGAHQTLLVTKAWTAITTQTLACDMLFYTGGMLQPAAGQVVTIGGGLSAQLHQIFDTSLGGNSSIVLSPNSAPGVYPQWFGVQIGRGTPIATQNQNLIALDACQHSVSGQGIPILITGRIEYNDPSTTSTAPGLQSLSNLTWRGTNQSAEIIAQMTQSLWGAINFCGTYIESPTTSCQGGNPPAALIHGIRGAYEGSTTLTASPTGGFSNVQVGSWIMVVEGIAPTYTTFRSYHKVAAINGDVITLDRPTELDFNGLTDPAAVFGVVLINPVHDVVVQNLKLSQAAGANSAYLVFYTAQAANITFENCTFNSEGAYDAEGYGCWSYKFRLIHNTWLNGGFDGWCAGSWGVQDGDYEMDVIGAMNAGGNGTNHVSVINSFFSGPTSSPDLFSGSFYHATISNNQFVNFATTPVISVAGSDVNISNNSFMDNKSGIIFDLTVWNTDLLKTHDISIVNNNFNSRFTSAAYCIKIPASGIVNNLIIENNILDCTVPFGWPSSILSVDLNGIVMNGNLDIQQVSPTGAGGGPGGGGVSNYTLSSIPIYTGFLKSTYNLPAKTNPQTFNPGDVILPSPANIGSTNTFAWIVKIPGTNGTLAAGITASTVNGSNIVTIAGGQVFGQRYYNIAGVAGTKKLVWQINATQWQMDQVSTTTGSGAAVTYSAPVFIQIPARQILTGTCALAGTGPFTCSSTFTTPYIATPTCTASNQSAAFAVQASATITAITATGETGSASGNTIAWTCTGNPN
jgi:hypothetical protein